MTDYKKYSLENLENWLYDAMSCGDATPQEIYDTIIKVVKDEYYTYKKRASESYELLALLNGNGGFKIEDILKERDYYEQSSITEEELSKYKVPFSCDKDDPSPECQNAWNDFWDKQDQVNRWVLPVELDGLSGECYVNLPDDLLERAGLKEGDMVHWIDRKDGSFEMRKVNGPE